MWKNLKRWLDHRRRRRAGPKVPPVAWLADDDNPWGVPVLDVRPVTQGMLSTSKNPEYARNAGSFFLDDGLGFLGKEPPISRRVETALRFGIDRLLAEGALFTPRAMEQKWALYYHRRQILCIRSWRRKVVAVADVEEHADHVEITSIRGTLATDDEEPAFTVRLLDFLLRSHALDMVYPAPLPAGMDRSPTAAALWCMSLFGNRALVATAAELAGDPPERPLRTDSLLHMAIARGDVEAATSLLDSGLPIDLLARDGLAPLHWALAPDGTAVLRALLDRGSAVDVRSAEDATPLMNAIQCESVEKAAFLLDHGADPNARDYRGFTSLHRAAEMGHTSLVTLLLERGAEANIESQGQTPLSLAEQRGKTAVVELLERA